MRDLKDLLEPLGDRPMPDRWDSIQRRPVRPLPEPHRSRLGAGVAAGIVAILAIAVIVWLSPLGGTGEQPAATPGGPPPSWLVDQAYQLAYENGDVVPDRTEWVLTDANTIAPAVGLQSGDPNVQEYLVVLHGHFTATVPTPPGANAPSGSVLVQSFSADSRAPLDFGVGDQAFDIPGLTSFDLPDASQIFVSPQGWTIPVPPGWRALATTVPAPRGPAQGTLITNATAPGSTPSGTEPAVASANFPPAGVAIVISDLPPDGQTQTVVPPIHWSDFSQVANDQGSTAWRVSLEGPRQIFSMEVRLGDNASPQDVAALHDMVAALAFGDQAGTLPSPSGAPGLPTQTSVVDDRFVSDAELDDGAFSVQPAPIDTVPVLTKADAERILLASPLFQGKTAGVVGFGLVTSQVSQHGVPTYQADPAWIAFGWGGVASCPNITAPPSPANLPSSGYVAVALVEGAGGGDVSYQSQSDTCGTVTGPTVGPATHVESVPWTANGQVTGGNLQITFTPPACAGMTTYSLAGSGDPPTLSVDVEAPDTPTSCSSPTSVTDVVQLNDASQTVTTVRHAPTGPVRQAQF
jgi:hypothetical protein